MKQLYLKGILSKWNVDLFTLLEGRAEPVLLILDAFWENNTFDGTYSDLSKKLGISIPTIKRLINQIRRAGIPIEFRKVGRKNAQYILRKDLI